MPVSTKLFPSATKDWASRILIWLLVRSLVAAVFPHCALSRCHSILYGKIMGAMMIVGVLV